MGRRNTQGKSVQCQHCGYTWNTQSTSDVTSCPKCGWRVRIRQSRSRDAPTSRELITTERHRELI